MENSSGKIRKCLECGREIYGRLDKKFCDENCKNRYHNQHYHSSSRLRDRIFTDLSTNHRILENLLKMGLTSVNLYDVQALGFKPSLVTGYAKKKGYDELRCFDICYRQTPERILGIKVSDLEESMRACQTPPRPSYGKSH